MFQFLSDKKFHSNYDGHNVEGLPDWAWKLCYSIPIDYVIKDLPA